MLDTLLLLYLFLSRLCGQLWKYLHPWTAAEKLISRQTEAPDIRSINQTVDVSCLISCYFSILLHIDAAVSSTNIYTPEQQKWTQTSLKQKHKKEAATTKPLLCHIYHSITSWYFSLQATRYLPQKFTLLNSSRKIKHHKNRSIKQNQQQPNRCCVTFTILFLRDIFLSWGHSLFQKHLHHPLYQRQIFCVLYCFFIVLL